jgi:cyclomaltodextrinase / maltogenic alpha-amylase / neopullulanase
MSINTPDWVKHAVFYQIFPDRFAKTTRDLGGTGADRTGSGDPSNVGKPHRPAPAMQVPLEAWDAPPTTHGYKGGDLWGIAENLDHLVDLGITAIYFTPIFQSASNHRYHTHDYYQIDPLLGGNEAFDFLLTAAHDRGLKVLLDGVFNHASRGFFYFNDILENGEKSPWLDWFRVEGWPLSPYDESKSANYKAWWGLRALPTFNHDNPHVREYLLQVAEYWLARGIDGWRLDVPGEVKTPGFWQEFRDRVKAVNPEAYIVGEIWDDATEWLDGTQFDGVMNYLFTGPTLAFVGGHHIQMPLVEKPGYFPYPAIDAVMYANAMVELLDRYPWEIQLTQLNLLSSHDVARVLSVVGGDRASLTLATLLLMTFPGAPSVYYGDEVGLAGGLDPDCRRGFPPQAQWDLSILDMHQQLIALRQQHEALRTGRYQVLATTGMALVFARHLDNDSPPTTRLVAVNAGETAVNLVVDAGDIQGGFEGDGVLFGSGSLEQDGGQLRLALPGRSGIIL